MSKEVRIVCDQDAEVRVAADSRTIEGFGIVFNKISHDLGGFREIILPEAIEGVIERSDVLALINHNPDKGVLARSTKGKGSMGLTTEERGVKYKFDAPNFDLGDELIEGIRRGDIKESSFAFTVAEEEWDYKAKPALRTIKKFDMLYDMSPCYRAAYSDTTVALRKLDELRKAEEDVIPEPEPEPSPAPVPTEKTDPEPEKININNLKTEKMTLTELRDLRAKAIEENDKVFETKKAENRTMTEKEEAMVAENNQRIKEYDLEIETESRKLGTDIHIGGSVKLARETKEKFSLIRAIRSKIEQRELPGIARDVFTLGKMAFRDAGINHSGDIVLPIEARADILAGAPTQGQEIVAEDKKSILPPLVDKLILAKAGATYMPGLVGNVSIPSYAGTSVAWKSEIDTADDGAGAFSEVEFSPKRLTAYIDVSKQFLLQDGVGAERLLLDNIANAVARKLEATILGVAAGSSTQPQGMGYLVTTADDFKANAIVPTYQALVALEAAVDSSNALVGNLAYITNANGRGILKSIDKGLNTDTGDYLCSETNMVNGYPLHVTNSCSAIAGDDDIGDLLVFGNWADLCIAQWGGYDITVDPYTLAISGQVRITINSYFDAKGLRGKIDTDAQGAATQDYEYAHSFASTAIKEPA